MRTKAKAARELAESWGYNVYDNMYPDAAVWGLAGLHAVGISATHTQIAFG